MAVEARHEKKTGGGEPRGLRSEAPAHEMEAVEHDEHREQRVPRAQRRGRIDELAEQQRRRRGKKPRQTGVLVVEAPERSIVSGAAPRPATRHQPKPCLHAAGDAVVDALVARNRHVAQAGREKRTTAAAAAACARTERARLRTGA